MTPKDILAACVQNGNVLSALSSAITSDLIFANPFHLKLGKFLAEFYMEHGKVPKKGDYEIWLTSQPVGHQGQLKELLTNLEKIDTSKYTDEYFIDEVSEGLQEIAAKNALARMNELGDSYSLNALKTLHQNVEKIQVVSLGDAVDVKDYRKWLDPKIEEEKKLVSGIVKLDEITGGSAPGLEFIVAPPNRGKTIYLVNRGHNAIMSGAKGIHITLEMSAEKVAHRYYRRAVQEGYGSFKNDLEKVQKGVEHWVKFAKGELLIIQKPAYSFTPEQFKALVKLFVDKYGSIDFVLLDYLDLMAPMQGAERLNLPAQLTRSAHFVRSSVLEHDAVVISATQPKVESYEKEVITMKDVGDSRGKLEAADEAYAFNQTPDEEMINQARLGCIKARDNAHKGIQIPLYVNKDYMYIGDLDHPNTRMLLNVDRAKGIT